VSAAGADGPSQFVVDTTAPGLTVTPLDGLDLTQRYASVALDDVVVPADSVVGEVGGSGSAVENQLRVACVLTTAETVGAMDSLFELTRRYTIDRMAFGRPIGSFQAVKHQMADMSLALEAAKAVAAAAARAVQERWPGAGEVVSMAKSWVADVGVDLVQGCAQVYAGIGFTWEHDLHLFLRRVTMNGLLFGPADWHRERLCRAEGL
jgi:alkylation response protein AidB-like acyl-CoA dehydrogenase